MSINQAYTVVRHAEAFNVCIAAVILLEVLVESPRILMDSAWFQPSTASAASFIAQKKKA